MKLRKLIAGPSVFVCDECIDLCNDIIKEESKELNEELEKIESDHFTKPKRTFNISW